MKICKSYIWGGGGGVIITDPTDKQKGWRMVEEMEKGTHERHEMRLIKAYLIRNFEPFQQCHKFLLDVRLLNIKQFTSGRIVGKANPHELSCTTQAAKIAASRGGG